ncbi:MAG TPA: hypothetical protein VMW35_10715 [Myxococcota bacterium]|nr:hypothetical protein [Myxococcota bacterium]
MSDTAVRNHRQKHLPETLVKAAELAEIDYSKDLVQQAHQIQKDALAVLESAKAAGNLGGVLQAIDRAQKGIALLAGVIEKLGGTEDREIVFSWQESVCPKCGGREGLASAPFPQADGRPTRA